MSVIANECGCHIALTIEKQLKNYSECAGHTDRHEILWHEWNHNKRWLAGIQQLILPSFPAYSMHDVSHSENVLYNIELLLGEENISQLSATDCFVILHTVYIHDIGMCITREDRENMVRNEKFIQYLEQQRDSGDATLKHYAEILLQECFKGGVSPEEKEKHILNKKLEVYYAVTYLMAEFRRGEHGDVSAKRLREWIDAPDKLGAGFSMLNLPNRLFYMIANCANTHTKWDFDEVLKLNQEDTGFAHDYVHPRFAAVLLQLGDALDMDNGRFHPLVTEFMGELPEASQIHYKKHQAIRRLRITNQKISIIADCGSQEVLRQIRQECDGIREILKNTSCYWSVIRPKELNIGLPTFDKAALLLEGKEIPESLVEAGFAISQEKAFNLLKGNNIYQDEKFVFLRELLQNAVDATKLQYFRDCSMQRKRIHQETFDRPVDAEKLIPPWQYPIEIEFSIARYKDGKTEVLEDNNPDNINNQLAGYDCGVLVKIRDNGIGISADDIAKIAAVGTSYENREEEIVKMPSWLQPTGTFGIGLQSVFLAADRLTAHTCSRKGSPYKITFYPQQGARRGYINVVPVADSGEEIIYGTCFELFVSNDKKRLHAEDPKTWDGLDPFGEEYDRRREIRHSIELMKQMALYLAEIIGEPLFPITITLKTKCVEESRMALYFSDEFKNNFLNAGLKLLIDKEEEKKEKERKKAEKEDRKKEEKGREEDGAENVLRTSWIYHIDSNKDGDTVWQDDKNIFRLDCRRAKLYIWNYEHSAFACIGIRRILAIREQINNSEEENLKQGANIFYKGIRVTERFFPGDANLVEYIDLKKTLEKDQLKLDRSGFSESGDEYLKKVYEAVVASARKALKYFGDGKCDNASQITDNIIGSIKKLLAKETDGEEQRASTVGSGRKRLDKSSREAEEVILSAAALAYFAMLDETDDLFDSPSISKNTVWNTLVKKMIALLNNAEKNGQGDGEINKRVIERINAIRESSSLYRIRIRAYNDMGERLASKRKEDSGADNTYASVLDIIEGDRKYAVVSVRDERSRFWKEILVELNADVHAKIKENVKRLRRTDNLVKRREIMSTLDDMARPLLEMAGRKDDSEIGQIRKEGVILKWILNNVPSMALFSSTDGNTRVNILDKEICHSVYYDVSMRALTIEKIRDKYARNRISRFSTTVWSGYGYLGVEKPRVSIQPVKRGKISDIGSSSLIVPLSGGQLEELYGNTKSQLNALKLETQRIYTSIIHPIIEYIDKEISAKEEYQTNDTISVYWTNLCKMLEPQEIDENAVELPEALEGLDEKLLGNRAQGGTQQQKELSEAQCEAIVESLKGNNEKTVSTNEGQGIESTSEEGQSTDNPSTDSSQNNILPYYIAWLKKIWGDREKLSEENFLKWYRGICETEEFQNLLKYTEENAGMKPSRKQVEALYFNYIREMKDSIRLAMEIDILKDFQKDFRNALINRTWVREPLMTGDCETG